MPAGTVLATERVSVDVKVAPGAKVKGLGEKTAVTPDGKAEVLRVVVNVLPALSLVILKA